MDKDVATKYCQNNELILPAIWQTISYAFLKGKHRVAEECTDGQAWATANLDFPINECEFVHKHILSALKSLATYIK